MLTRSQNKKGLTRFNDITICIDRSGSMRIFSDSVRDGVIDLLQTHGDAAASAEVEYNLRIVSFDNNVTVLYTGSASELIDDIGQLDSSKLELITRGLVPRGTTRLYDTVMEEIKAQSDRCTAYKAGVSAEVCRLGLSMSVIFILLTDGEDNASDSPINIAAPLLCRTMKEHCKNYSVSAQFIAANQNAIETGTSLGFPADTCLQMDADPHHGRAAMASATASSMRTVSGQDSAFRECERAASSQLSDHDPWSMDHSVGSLDIRPFRN